VNLDSQTLVWQSCEQGVYIHHQNSQVFQTAWAILALLAAKYPEPEPIKRACRLIISRQTDDGQWLEDAVEGVFNKTTSLTYPNYKFAWYGSPSFSSSAHHVS
jgi:lanosterol synthase